MIVDTCSIILAAGAGCRYKAESGHDKLLVRAFADDPDSLFVLRMAVEAFVGVTDRCLLVVSTDNPQRVAHASRLGPELGVELLLIDTQGLGHSLVQAVKNAPVRSGWLVGLADMPYVRRATVQRMAATITPETLAVPVHAGRRGHPRVIGSSYGTQVSQLVGDAGAHMLFGRECLEIGVDDPGTTLDIDIPDHRLAVSP